MTDWAKLLIQTNENSEESIALRNEIGNLRYEIEKLRRENALLKEENKRLKNEEQHTKQDCTGKINERIRHRSTQFF